MGDQITKPTPFLIENIRKSPKLEVWLFLGIKPIKIIQTLLFDPLLLPCFNYRARVLPSTLTKTPLLKFSHEYVFN